MVSHRLRCYARYCKVVQGALIGEYFPFYTGGWETFSTVTIPIDDVVGVDDLTLRGADMG